MAVLHTNAVYCAVCGYLSVLSFGYMIGYSSPALPQMTKPTAVMYNKPEVASWFGSIPTLGAIIGCILTAFSVDRCGRRAVIIVSAIPCFAGHTIIAVSSDVMMLCFGRFLAGIASGASSVAAPLFVAETAPKDSRGLLGAGIQLAVTTGILIVYALGAMLHWRTLAAIGAAVPLLAVIVTLGASETPHYMLLAGRGREETVAALVWLRGGTMSEAEDECIDMEKTAAESSADKASLCDLFSQRDLYRPLVVAFGLMALQQAVGISAVMFYSVSIFEVF